MGSAANFKFLPFPERGGALERDEGGHRWADFNGVEPVALPIVPALRGHPGKPNTRMCLLVFCRTLAPPQRPAAPRPTIHALRASSHRCALRTARSRKVARRGAGGMGMERSSYP